MDIDLGARPTRTLSCHYALCIILAQADRYHAYMHHKQTARAHEHQACIDIDLGASYAYL
jgi:hypothetical protein